MSKNTVQPVTVLRTLGWVSFFPSITVDIMWIVASANKAKLKFSRIDQSVGACLEESLAFITLIK